MFQLISISIFVRFGFLCAVAMLYGCSFPTVQPWEKENLSKASMQFDVDRLESSLIDHIYFSKEAASSGRSVGGGGCGCN